MKDSLKGKFLILALALSVTFTLAPIKVAHAGNALGGIGAIVADALTFGTVSMGTILAGSYCVVGIASPLCNSDSGVTPTLASQNGGGSSCQLAITSTFYIPSFNYDNGNPPGAVIDETKNKIALYRFSWPISKFQDSLGNLNSNMFGMWTISTGVGDGYGTGGGFSSQFGGGWAANGGSVGAGYFAGNGASVSDSPIATYDYSQICKGNVCTIKDVDNVPQNAYVFYVAKILGNYSGMEVTIGDNSNPVTYNDSQPISITYPVKPNKFLSTENLGSGKLATLPSLYKDGYSMGNVYGGPYKTGKPVCPISITTESLAGGTIGTPYSATVEGSGGTESFVWSAVGLPAGLSISTPTCVASPCKVPGTISGTPTTAGTYGVVVQLKSGDQTISKQFSVVVSSAATPAASAAPATQNVSLTQSSDTTTSDGTTGLPFTLTWSSSKNETYCGLTKTVNGGAPQKVSCYAEDNALYGDAFHRNGSCQPAPNVIGTHIFSFTCAGDSEEDIATQKVTHYVTSSTAAEPTPATGDTTAAIYQSSDATEPGDAFTVTWNSTNAKACIISDTIPGVAQKLPFGWTSQPYPNKSGSAVATPTTPGTHIFSIVCTGTNNVAQKTVSHIVSGSVTCANGATNSSCTFKCERCSTENNYTYATFDSDSSDCYSTTANNTNVVYTCKPSCGVAIHSHAYGNCTASPSSACSKNMGASCFSTANTCGKKGAGTIQCNGSCSATVPPSSFDCSPPASTI